MIVDDTDRVVLESHEAEADQQRRLGCQRNERAVEVVKFLEVELVDLHRERAFEGSLVGREHAV